MNAVLDRAALAQCQATTPKAESCALVLLGTGGVGGAFLKLLSTPVANTLRLVGVADSKRQLVAATGLSRAGLDERLAAQGVQRDNSALLAALAAADAPIKVVIDATANIDLAAQHPQWLAHGIHVVTANKALAGGNLAGWQTLQAVRTADSEYGDTATVGAGLPILFMLRRLRACGDRLLGLQGVFSGSLSWLFNQYDGSRPFSELLHEAWRLGYTEPDPRLDLSGEDVARKLLILARTAGWTLERDSIQVENLVPGPLRTLQRAAFLARAEQLDAPLARRQAQAQAHGAVLRYLACVDGSCRARVGLVEVPAGHPAAHLQGSDNLFMLRTQRYSQQPLVIQGPGAGPEVTAQALLGDVLALS